MECNVGKADRTVRIFLTIVFAILGFYISKWFFIIAVILLVTAIVGFCGPYKLLGINTCKKRRKKK